MIYASPADHEWGSRLATKAKQDGKFSGLQIYPETYSLSMLQKSEPPPPRPTNHASPLVLCTANNSLCIFLIFAQQQRPERKRTQARWFKGSCKTKPNQASQALICGSTSSRREFQLNVGSRLRDYGEVGSGRDGKFKRNSPSAEGSLGFSGGISDSVFYLIVRSQK